ncbi:hypothetical protein I7I48_06970 [Histoplasma ohiense]|nr:hypothetical protein I7I48_06970 [Histoplasma ohiense (nom. inval.)]
MLEPFCHSQPACGLRRLHSCFCSGHTNTHLSASLSPPPFSVWALCRKSAQPASTRELLLPRKPASQFVDRLFAQYWRSQSVLSSLVERSLFSTPPFPGWVIPLMSFAKRF